MTAGGIVVKCGEPLKDVVIYNTRGQVVRRVDEVRNDDFISLPAGIYILTTRSSRQAYKAVIF